MNNVDSASRGPARPPGQANSVEHLENTPWHDVLRGTPLWDATWSTGLWFDWSDRTRIEIRGCDRQRFLHNLCTQDIARLSPGEGCEAFATNVQGKVVGHLAVFCEADRVWIHAAPGQATTLIPHWDRYLITEDVQLADRQDAEGTWLIVGPATELLSRGGRSSLPVEAVPYAHGELELNGARVQVAQVPWLNLPAVLLWADQADHASISAWPRPVVVAPGRGFLRRRQG